MRQRLLLPLEPASSSAAAPPPPATPGSPQCTSMRLLASHSYLPHPPSTPPTCPPHRRRRVVARSTGCSHPALAEELYQYYASGAAWVASPGAGDALRRIRARGVRTAVVSNFDTRLAGVLRELGLADAFDAVVVSADVSAAFSPCSFGTWFLPELSHTAPHRHRKNCSNTPRLPLDNQPNQTTNQTDQPTMLAGGRREAVPRDL